MRALVLTSTPPVVPGRHLSGVYTRLRMEVRALAAAGAEVDMVYLVPPAVIAADSDPAVVAARQSSYFNVPVTATLLAQRTRQENFANHYLRGMFSVAQQRNFYGFSGAALAAEVGTILDRGYDLVFALELNAALPVVRSGRRPRRLLLDFIDVIHPVAIRAHLHPPIWPGKLAYLTHIPALIAAERRAARAASLVIVCSDIERRRLRGIGVGGEIYVLENALPMPVVAPPCTAEPTLMFIGAFDSVANIDAAERLALRIMPLLRARVPAARLLIAGARSDALPSRAAAPAGVDYLGFVDDLDDLYARSRVICCPIMIGGGTRTKLIEAAAYARPMVSTRIGAEGLAFVDGEDILLRDSDAEIAAACAGLLTDDAACDRLGAAARARMRTHYEASAVADRFADTVRTLLARG